MDHVRIIDEQELAPDLEAAIRQTLVTCFPKDAEFFSRSRAWHGSSPAFSALVAEDERVIAHLGVVQRRITVGGSPVEVAGIQNACVLDEHRGQGFCRETLAAATTEARSRGVDFGLLFCVAELVPVYERCGWKQLLDQPVVRIDSDGVEKPLEEGNLPMWLPLGADDFPRGTVHLGGNDW